MIDYLEQGTSSSAVVVCHGFGANMRDLLPIAEEVRTGAPLRWILPQAPVTLPGYPAGRAWFPRELPELEAFASGASFHDLAEVDPRGLRESADEVLALLKRLDVDPARSIIGGFSQGAMVAVETALTAGVRFAGIAVLSGTLIAAARWRGLATRLQGVPVFQSHGRADPLLPYSQAVQLREVLTAGGAQVTFAPFHGGHALPPAAVEALTRFVRVTASPVPSAEDTGTTP